MVTAATILKETCSLKGNLWQTNLDSILKAKTSLCSPRSHQSFCFTSSCVLIRELDTKEGRAPNNWCFWIVLLEKTLESRLDCKEIKPINLKGNQPWIFIGRTDTEAEAPIFWHLMWRADSLEKTLMLGKIEGRRRRGWQRMRWLDSISDSMDMNLNKLC